MVQDRAEFRRMQIATMATNAADRSNMQSVIIQTGKESKLKVTPCVCLHVTLTPLQWLAGHHSFVLFGFPCYSTRLQLRASIVQDEREPASGEVMVVQREQAANSKSK